MINNDIEFNIVWLQLLTKQPRINNLPDLLKSAYLKQFVVQWVSVTVKLNKMMDEESKLVVSDFQGI